jgi:hypothetical protein
MSAPTRSFSNSLSPVSFSHSSSVIGDISSMSTSEMYSSSYWICGMKIVGVACGALKLAMPTAATCVMARLILRSRTGTSGMNWSPM